MSETMQNMAYDDMAARPGFYVPGFDPRQFLRASTDEEGRQELTLDVKHRKHWFRLVHPNGKITTDIIAKDERHAVVNARVYADRADPIDQFLAEGKAERFAPADPMTAKPYELYFYDWAETVAIGRALANAGFDVPFVNAMQNGMTVNAMTGEVLDTSQPNPAVPSIPQQQAPAQTQQRQYSNRTAPPAQAGPLIQSPASTPQKQAQPARGNAGAAARPAASGQQTFAAQPPAQQVLQVAPMQGQQTLQAAPMQGQPAQPAEPRNEAEALQMPLEWALNYPVQVGAFAGKKLGEVARQNPGALNWYVKTYRGNDFKLRAAAQILLDQAMAKAG